MKLHAPRRIPGRISPRAATAAAAVVLLWASAFVGVKVALRDFSPGQLAFARYLVASAVFLALMARRRPTRPPTRDLLRLAFAGGIGIAVYNLALNTGQKTVSPGIASLLVNTVPVWTSLLSYLLLRERISKLGWLGTTISFAGVSIIGLQQSSWTGFDPGILLILTAAAAQALYFVVSKPLLERYHPIEVTAWAVWFGCLCLTPFQVGLVSALRQSSASSLGWVLFLGIGPAAFAYLAWSYVLEELPAGKASNVLFLVPVVAIALGWLVLDDVPSPIALLGGGLSVLGVIFSRGLRPLGQGAIALRHARRGKI